MNICLIVCSSNKLKLRYDSGWHKSSAPSLYSITNEGTSYLLSLMGRIGGVLLTAYTAGMS